MPTPAQIKEIEDLIREARKIDPAGFEEKAAEKYQEAIRKADKYYGILSPPNLEKGEPKFDSTIAPGRALAETSPGNNQKINIGIGSAAFIFPYPNGKPSAAWLAAVKVHELIGHAANIVWTELEITMTGGKKVKYKISVKPEESEDELGAYLEMLIAAERLGLAEEMIEVIKKKAREYWERLDEKRRWVWRWKYKPWIQF